MLDFYKPLSPVLILRHSRHLARDWDVVIGRREDFLYVWRGPEYELPEEGTPVSYDAAASAADLVVSELQRLEEHPETGGYRCNTYSYCCWLSQELTGQDHDQWFQIHGTAGGEGGPSSELCEFAGVKPWVALIVG